VMRPLSTRLWVCAVGSSLVRRHYGFSRRAEAAPSSESQHEPATNQGDNDESSIAHGV
jgi:hypothetical protein